MVGLGFDYEKDSSHVCGLIQCDMPNEASGRETTLIPEDDVHLGEVEVGVCLKS